METPTSQQKQSAIPAFVRSQRSHLLFVLSNHAPGFERQFISWYRDVYLKAVLGLEGVLSGQQYERHEVDITQGAHAPLPFQYLGIHELSLDGAKEADGLIERITGLHAAQPSAQAPATWLYYPSSERVGRRPRTQPSIVTLAFTNAILGEDEEFREWYTTRHIRHALNVSALVSGQCFERTQFQRPGAMSADFSRIALYEQEGSPEEIIANFASLPEGILQFPTLDLVRFAEWVYRPI